MSRQLNLISLPEQVNHTTGNLSSGSRTSSRQSGPLATEIALDQLRVNDQIVIRTAHGTYIFLVIDPSKHLGLVVGGVFGDYAVEAFLEVAPVTRDQLLKAGMRVCFYIGSIAGGKRVTTSAVTDLNYRRTGTEQSR
jgi:hypothetical protein